MASQILMNKKYLDLLKQFDSTILFFREFNLISTLHKLYFSTNPYFLYSLSQSNGLQEQSNKIRYTSTANFKRLPSKLILLQQWNNHEWIDVPVSKSTFEALREQDQEQQSESGGSSDLNEKGGFPN